MEVYQLKKNILVKACKDGFVRVLKKNSQNRFAIETLYIVSKIQGVILAFFGKANTITAVSENVAEIYSLDSEAAKRAVTLITERFSGLMDSFELEGTKALNEEFDWVKVKEILAADTKKICELKAGHEKSAMPQSLVVFVTNTCMCNCLYCRVDSGICEAPQFISSRIINKVAAECKKYGITDVELTGGDPLTHPDFMELLSIFKRNDIPVAFSTKCPIHKRKLMGMKQAGIQFLQFSLDTINKELFARLTKTSSDYFEKLMTSIKEASLLGIQVKIKSVITRLNIGQFPRMIEILYSYGIRDFTLQQLSYGDRNFPDELLPLKEQYVALEKDIDELMQKYEGIKIDKAYNIEYLFAPGNQKKYFRQDCMAGRKGLVIQVDGSYAYCGQSFNENLRFLNAQDVDIMEAWNSKELELLTNPDREVFYNTKCYDCKDFEICKRKRCYIRTFNKWGRIFDVDPMCPYFEE